MILKLVSKPLISTLEHFEITLFERADIWLEVTKDMLPVLLRLAKDLSQ